MLFYPLLASAACGPGQALDSTTTGESTAAAATGESTGAQPTTGTATPGSTSSSDASGTSTGDTGLGTSGTGPDADTSSGTTGTLPDSTSGSSTTTDPGETGTDSSTGGVDFMCITGGDPPAPKDPDPCACIVDQEPGPLDPFAPTCGAHSCDKVLAADMGNEVMNPDALQCALEALRDRKPGLLRYDIDVDGNYAEYTGYILILDDGTAIVRRWGHEDLSYWVGSARHVELPDPCAFEQCLAETFNWERIDCLNTFPYDTLSVCDKGWGGDL